MACRRGGLRGEQDSLEFDSMFKITHWYFLEIGALQSLSTGNNNSDNTVVSRDTVSTSVQNNNQEVIELRGLVKQEEERLQEQAAYLDDEKSITGVGQQQKVKDRVFGAVKIFLLQVQQEQKLLKPSAQVE